MHTKQQSGFTLIEIMVAAALIMILAGIAVVSLASTEEDAMVASTKQQLQRVRTAVDYFMFQHQEDVPGYDNGIGSWTENALTSQLTQATDNDGDWAAPGTAGFPYGPYLLEGVPTNPFNELKTIIVVPPAGPTPYPNDASGWVFFGSTGIFRCNSTGTTPDGEPLYEL